jgi:hypothetical protein
MKNLSFDPFYITIDGVLVEICRVEERVFLWSMPSLITRDLYNTRRLHLCAGRSHREVETMVLDQLHKVSLRRFPIRLIRIPLSAAILKCHCISSMKQATCVDGLRCRSFTRNNRCCRNRWATWPL